MAQDIVWELHGSFVWNRSGKPLQPLSYCSMQRSSNPTKSEDLRLNLIVEREAEAFVCIGWHDDLTNGLVLLA